MSHVLHTVQTSKTFPRSQCQRSSCTVYPQRPGSAYHTSSDIHRHVKSPRGVRTVDQTLRQDDKYLAPTVARRRCTTQSPRTRSPGDASGRKRSRHSTKPEIMSSATSRNPVSPADDESGKLILPISEFSAVKENFVKFFSQCSEILCLSISCALSCVLRSFRPLRRMEIAGAVILFLASRSVSTSEFACEKDLSASWLEECGGILAEDENGYVHFAQSSIRFFLSNYQIHGVDSTHATISMICLSQVEIQTSQRVRQNAQSACGKAQLLAATALSEYAGQFWVRHYQAIQNTRADLARKVHRLLSIRWGDSNSNVAHHNAASIYANAPAEAVDFCIQNDLHVLAELYQQGKQNTNISPLVHQQQRPKNLGGGGPSPNSRQSQLVAKPPPASDLELTNEAFEQLGMTDSAETASSSECEDWTKLRRYRR